MPFIKIDFLRQRAGCRRAESGLVLEGQMRLPFTPNYTHIFKIMNLILCNKET